VLLGRGFQTANLTAFALNIDNLGVGVALSIYRAPIVLAAIVIATVSAFDVLSGLNQQTSGGAGRQYPLGGPLGFISSFDFLTPLILQE
jgi:hypothetical protein